MSEEEKRCAVIGFDKKPCGKEGVYPVSFEGQEILMCEDCHAIYLNFVSNRRARL